MNTTFIFSKKLKSPSIRSLSIKIRITIIGFVFMFFTLVVSCAVVTTYGKMPQQDSSDKDVLYFTFYYNSFSGVREIDQYAFGVIEKFMAEQGYTSYRIVERHGDNPALNKVIYKVRFWREKQQLTAEEYYKLGNTHFENGKWREAVDYYSEAIKIYPKYSAAYFCRGLAYEFDHQVDLSISDYCNAIKIEPDNALYYTIRGGSYNIINHFDLAILDFTKALELNPKEDRAYYGRGTSYFNKKQYNRAKAEFDKSIEINPSKADYLRDRGFANSHIEDYDLAIVDFKKAIELNPEDDETYGGLGYVSIIKGEKELKRTISFLNKIVDKYPNKYWPYLHRSLMYKTTKEYDKAWKDIRTVQSLNFQVPQTILDDLRKASGRNQ